VQGFVKKIRLTECWTFGHHSKKEFFTHIWFNITKDWFNITQIWFHITKDWSLIKDWSLSDDWSLRET